MSDPCVGCGRYLRAYGKPYPEGAEVHREHAPGCKRPAPKRKRDARPVRIVTPSLVKCLPALRDAKLTPRWIGRTERWAEQRVSHDLAALIDATRKPKDMLTMAAAAAELGISRQAVKGLADRGQLELRTSVVDARAATAERQRSNGGGVPTTFVTRASLTAYMLAKGITKAKVTK